MKTDAYNPSDISTIVTNSKYSISTSDFLKITKQDKSGLFNLYEFKDVKSRLFELNDNLNSQKRTYLNQFDENRTTFAAVEILLLNPLYDKRDIFLSGIALWYLDNELVGKNLFNLEMKKDWQIVEFVQSWGTPQPGFWKSGEGKVEIYLENSLLIAKPFMIGETEIIDLNENTVSTNNSITKQTTSQPKIVECLDKQISEKESFQSVLDELNEYVGLKNFKQSILDFITYLNFINERKRKGIVTEENLIPHCIFLGNPGTGKTSIARLLGKYFKSIGMLENGHVIEVDRAALVGEYVGATAQKTERLINQAFGGILFIDEAYTLKPMGNSADFGQEAIDVILKRMEDLNGKFIVIAAGYPSLMKSFIDSNPGLKSRFTHTFLFDDYSAAELTDIFIKFALKEKYFITKESTERLTSLLEIIFTKSDEQFGNARFIRNLFNETKIQLSKRYQLLSYDRKNYAALSTIVEDDIINAFNNQLHRNSTKNINESKYEKYYSELNNLVGLEDVKLSATKLISSIKLENIKTSKGIGSVSKNLNSIFIGLPGSGTTTVAKLLGKLFKELNQLESGELLEIDSSLFYGLNNLDSFLIIDRLFQESKGKIILINDAVITLKAKSDFSDSLLQYFLKKLFLNQNNPPIILYGSNDDMKELIDNVPVIENQFPNVFAFQEYSNRQLLEIGWRISKKKNYILDEGAWQILYEIICDIKSRSNKPFFNAQGISNILEKAIYSQEKRIIEKEKFLDTDLMTLTYEDFKELLIDIV